ncbi:hypothetical protein PHLGIDRAFT_29423 [Phlebiopsis gigantea 11061_1 CR5-6]|uniref:Uncharacterized protein n=1 Tax=Phlebiopsis gigantea (strain 11061_1 CR5-6) TaxID=745531 RepID=A0A0C3SA02_PHLG1|nr:hypothetical protein PHLGIDRAFT_29423 [Phlebiopsis gigantea 11061_1 CR5-6]
MPEYKEFEAWITCDGQRLREFHPAQEGKEASCWVSCELGKRFTVHWMDKGTSVQSAGYLMLDGMPSAGRFLFGFGTTQRSTVRIDKDTESPLYFAKADSPPRLSNPRSSDVCIIALKIRLVKLEDLTHSPNPVRGVPRPADATASTGGACIGFGQPERTTRQHDTTWRFKPYDLNNPSHYVKFVWRYRTEEFLRDQGIMKAEDTMYIGPVPVTLEVAPNLDAGPPTPASSSQDSPQTSSGKRSYYRPHLQSLPTYQTTTPSRLKFLYSDFSGQKHSNPSSFATNVDWWRRTLEAVVGNGWQRPSVIESNIPDRLVLHAPGPLLAEEFRMEGAGKPLGLATVVVSNASYYPLKAELCQQRSYFPLSQFLNATQSIYDSGWLPYRIASFVVGKPLWWALQQLSVVSSDDTYGSEERWKKVKGDYVVLSLLERAAAAVLAQQMPKTGVSLAESLYNFDSFKAAYAERLLPGTVLSDLDLKVLLRYLERDKQMIVRQGEVIKFVEGVSDAKISAVDRGVLELKTAVENMESTINHIHERIDSHNEKISGALRQKRKEDALSHLRARKQYDDLLKKRLNSLDTLRATLIRVEAAAGDVEIMKSYESSTATLRAILAHPSLQRGKIDETMDAMAAAQADAADIDVTIRMGADMAQTDAGIDDSELQDELATLIKEAEDEKAATRKVQEEETATKMSDKALRVPSHDPTITKTVGRDLAVGA